MWATPGRWSDKVGCGKVAKGCWREAQVGGDGDGGLKEGCLTRAREQRVENGRIACGARVRSAVIGGVSFLLLLLLQVAEESHRQAERLRATRCSSIRDAACLNGTPITRMLAPLLETGSLNCTANQCAVVIDSVTVFCPIDLLHL